MEKFMLQYIKQCINRVTGRRSRVSFPNGNQVCVFNRRLTLHRDLTSASLQEAIDELQRMLYGRKLLKTMSGRFDAETEEAVKEFQRQNNLYVDGVVGPLTWSCLCYPRLSRRDKTRSPEAEAMIRQLQNILQCEGFLGREPTGRFDWQTDRAIRRFQRTYGLRSDGVAGAATWAVLLGMRQRSEKRSPYLVYPLPAQSHQFWRQSLMVACILLGIYHSPLPGTPPHLKAGVITAYGLSYLVPRVLDCLPLRRSESTNFVFLQYAPYVLTGMLWKPLIQLLEELVVK